jgi:hypothetical protein
LPGQSPPGPRFHVDDIERYVAGKRVRLLPLRKIDANAAREAGKPQPHGTFAGEHVDGILIFVGVKIGFDSSQKVPHTGRNRCQAANDPAQNKPS